VKQLFCKRFFAGLPALLGVCLGFSGSVRGSSAPTIPALFGNQRCSAQVCFEDANQGPTELTRVFVGLWGEGKNSPQGRALLTELITCMRFMHIFEVTYEILDEAPTAKADIVNCFAKENYHWALYLSYDGLQKPIEWRMYNTQLGTMVSGKRVYGSHAVVEVARDIACRLVKKLISMDAPFLNKIAYVEQDDLHHQSILWRCDYDGSNKKKIAATPYRLLVPRWGKWNEGENPFLVVSKSMLDRVSLVAFDMQTGRQYQVVDKRGTTAVGMSYAPHAQKVAYGRSGKIWLCDGEQLPHCVLAGAGDCASPTILDSGDIIYCSSGKIWWYDAQTRKSRVLFSDGFCVSPAYDPINKQVVYAKSVKGTMQLCLYDMATKRSTQLTTDAGNKADPSLAPGGRFCLFVWEQGMIECVALLDLMTKKYTNITPPGKRCRGGVFSPACGGFA